MNKIENKVIDFIKEKHKDQVDKIGKPYYEHPIAVMNSLSEQNERILALLHDVIEDTDTTIDEVYSFLHTNDVSINDIKIILKGLECITKTKWTSYSEYLEKVKICPIAFNVKLADIAHNTSESRLRQLDKDTRKRLIDKYNNALDYLLDIKMDRYYRITDNGRDFPTLSEIDIDELYKDMYHKNWYSLDPIVGEQFIILYDANSDGYRYTFKIPRVDCSLEYCHYELYFKTKAELCIYLRQFKYTKDTTMFEKQIELLEQEIKDINCKMNSY